MRKLKHQKTMPGFSEWRGRKNVTSKVTVIFIALFLVAIVVFLVTMLSLTHGLMEYRTTGTSGYVGFFVNYHVALMIILVAAAIIFGAAIYYSLKENNPKI
ncbi:MAG TPA: hypothetical protein VJG83_02375 [archaeon]|nr:hypothetical protein [archaeon]